MSNYDIGSLLVTLCLMIPFIHSMGFLFEKLKQPKLVGEIVSGIILGPYILGQIHPYLFSTLFANSASGVNKGEIVLNFIYWIGLFLLMFLSGSETRKLLSKESYKDTAWLLLVGTPLPFLLILFLGLNDFIPLSYIVGSAGEKTSALLVLAISVVVTSIPVLSRIFYDLKILHTRFAGLILGTAVLEDIILWGILAIATGMVAQTSLSEKIIMKEVATHVLITFLYMGLGLTLAPHFLKKIHSHRFNFLIDSSPVAYLLFILFLYTSLAYLLRVNLVFSAFLAGFGLIGGIKGSERERFSSPLDSLGRVASGFFIPLYFCMVGQKMVFGRDFSLSMFFIFLILSSFVSILSVALAARLAGFKKLDLLNLAITCNARGGPGIVLASVAYEAGIINAPFYTTLVLTSVVTSQMAGVWLKNILDRGLPLLSSSVEETIKN